MNEIKVSIIVPIYNTEKFLRKCIESIVNQTLQEIEIILINDGSTDNSHNICLEYAEKYCEKIRYINNKNIGCSATRNLGINLAKGEYITFVDSDDYVEKEIYDLMYKKGIEEKADIIISGFKYIFSDREHMFVPKFKGNLYDYLDVRNKPSYVWNKLYKKDLVINNNIYFPIKTHYCEDLVFSFETLCLAKKVSIVEKSLYNYILHGGNSIYNLDKKLDTKISFSTVYCYLKKQNLFENKNIVKYFYQNFHYSGVKNIFISLANPEKISKNEAFEYANKYEKMFKEIEFRIFKTRILVLYYKFLIFFIRKFSLYSILKKIKNKLV